MERIRVQLSGQVQGVGFRPFVLRLANSLDLRGYVQNSGAGVLTEAEGPAEALAAFVAQLRTHAPPSARVSQLQSERLRAEGLPRFEIRESVPGVARPGLVPDLAVCPDCSAELRDPCNRRYAYPFISCAACGPRFSVAYALPYDRERTSMRAFPLCDACRAEYLDPSDRRHHAQGIACASCGPRVFACDGEGRTLARDAHALACARAMLERGGIVAVKALTGFQLLVAADQPAAVARLRARKGRPAKPLAIIAADLLSAERWVELDAVGRAWLTAPEGPIVLLPRKPGADAVIAAAVGCGSAWHGVMLPTTPLHHLLLEGRAAPLVATSGNRSSEPLCRSDAEALERLRDVADLWLLHDREIVRALDDSLLRIAAGRTLLLRRARGFAPRTLSLREHLPDVLALGGHGKNTLAVSHGQSVLVSAHVGDLDSALSRQVHAELTRELPALMGAQPSAIASDTHPDYASGAAADDVCRTWSARRVRVQHHLAHVLAVVAEHGLSGPLLGVAWDGSGFGADGGSWGGEFFTLDERGARRCAHLRPFPLLGGERAAREPRRIAFALLHEAFGWEHASCREALAGFGFSRDELHNLALLARKASRCTSVGRLFDAVASLLGLCQVARFEAEAASALEAAAGAAPSHAAWPVVLSSEAPCEIDWRPLLSHLLSEHRKGTPAPPLARAFHDWLARSITAVAERTGLSECVLAGGCFQNAFLVEAAVTELERSGRRAHLAGALPTNDGGLALGQLYAAARGIELI